MRDMIGRGHRVCKYLPKSSTSLATWDLVGELKR